MEFLFQEFNQTPHRGVDTRFLSDILFSQNPFYFLIHTPFPLREIILLMLFEIVFWSVQMLFV